MSDSNQRKNGVLLSYVSIFINIIIQLLYTLLLIRNLGQSEYGLYSLVSNIIGYLTLLDLGFGNAIVVFTSKYRAKGEHEKEKRLHGMVSVIFGIIGIIAIILGVILYFNVENIFSSSMTSLEIKKMKIMMIILTFNLAMTFFFNVYSSIITAYERFTYQKIISILSSILRPLIMIPFLFLGYKSITMCLVITIVNIIVLLSNYFYCKKKLNIEIKYKGFDKNLLKMIIGYSFFIFLNVIVDKINYNVDQVILGTMYGTVAVSVYSVASVLDQFFLNVSTAISGVFLPKMSKYVAEKADSQVLTNEFIKIGRIQYYIIFLICTGFILVGKDFIIFWVGKDYIDAYYITLCLIIPSSVPLIQNVGLSIMQAMNKHKFKAIVTTIMSIFNVIISLFLARKFGAIGAAIGTTISIIVCNIFLINIYYYKTIKIDVIKFWKEILGMTCWFLIPLGLTILIMFLTKFSGILSVILYASIYSILYILTSYFFIFNDYEKGIVNPYLKKLKLIK